MTYDHILIAILGVLSICGIYLSYQYTLVGRITKPKWHRRSMINTMRSRRSAPSICPHHALDLALGQMAVLSPGRCDICDIGVKKQA